MYINVHKHIESGKSVLFEDKEINYYFIYVTLRNLVYDLKRKEKKVKYEQLNCLKDLQNVDIEYKEDPYFKLKTITEWLEHDHFLELIKEDTSIEGLTKEKMQVYYLRRIFQEVFLEGKKVSRLSKDSRITYWSLRNTIKTIKQEIKSKYEARY